MNTSKKKTDYWWYRFLQVFYVLLILFFLCVIGGATYAAVPKLDEYSSTYRTHCDNGMVLGNFKGSELAYGYTEFETSLNQETMRFLCSRPDIAPEDRTSAFREAKAQDHVSYIPVFNRQFQTVTNPLIPKDKNYQIVLEEKAYDGSWWIALAVFVGMSILGFLLALITRAIFLYVAFKEPFAGNMLVLAKRRKITQ